ncbi:MAG TPA: alpha/beta hydrolase [Streptosporangiaceae bacterium]
MRDARGRTVPVNGGSVYVEESGTGPGAVVFEAGMGCGRTCWDPVLPALAGRARLVAYDRAGRARTGAPVRPTLDGMAADLVALAETVAPDGFVLVAHSMGGLIARRAAESLGGRLRGLLLIDPTPETAPAYATWDDTAAKIDRSLAVAGGLARVPALAGLLSRDVKRLYGAATYATMIAEDFTHAGIAQNRAENRAVAAAVRAYRAEPPRPPECPTVVLGATRPPGDAKRAQRQAEGRDHQRRYAESLPHGRYEPVDSGHFIQAEHPVLVAERTRLLLDGHA